MGVGVIFTWPKTYFNVRALIFYVCEGSNQAIKNAKNYGINIFDYVFDTHGSIIETIFLIYVWYIIQNKTILLKLSFHSYVLL